MLVELRDRRSVRRPATSESIQRVVRCRLEYEEKMAFPVIILRAEKSWAPHLANLRITTTAILKRQCLVAPPFRDADSKAHRRRAS